MSRFFGGEICDISVGGFSFAITTRNRKMVRTLLGRTLRISIELNLKGKTREYQRTGIIRGMEVVNLHDYYSIHVEFHRQLPQKDLNIILKS